MTWMCWLRVTYFQRKTLTIERDLVPPFAEHSMHGLGARALRPHNAIARIVSEPVAFSKNCVAPPAIVAIARAVLLRCDSCLWAFSVQY